MAAHDLTDHFDTFFRRLNPRPEFEHRAAAEHSAITALIEYSHGPASVIAPRCFLQGSYKQETAIYSINDVDVVALCRLWFTSGGGQGRIWSRDDIFATIAAPLLADRRYRDKVSYGPTSMCIKVNLDIRIEILPVIYHEDNSNPQQEPFKLYRSEQGRWEDGFARYHQGWLTEKNRDARTGGNFIPAIKVLKHLRNKYGLEAVSFHIECLLFRLPDHLFSGGPADYISATLGAIAATDANSWWQRRILTPCGDRDIFTSGEWGPVAWERFHDALKVWARAASVACTLRDRQQAIDMWQTLLGKDFFPQYA